eukprot:1161320-Pelagomonas_calceolata.AAC.6
MAILTTLAPACSCPNRIPSPSSVAKQISTGKAKLCFCACDGYHAAKLRSVNIAIACHLANMPVMDIMLLSGEVKA